MDNNHLNHSNQSVLATFKASLLFKFIDWCLIYTMVFLCITVDTLAYSHTTVQAAELPASVELTQLIQVGSSTQTEVKRISRTVFDFSYTLNISYNGATPLQQVKGHLISLSSSTQVIDGDVDFGNLAPVQTLTSKDTYTIRQDRTKPFNPSDLKWSFTYNHPPVANAGPNQTGTAGQTITLDGKDSFDADGDSMSFLWSLLRKPADSKAALKNLSNPAQVSLTLDLPGEYVSQLIVNDGHGISEPDTSVVTVTVQPPLNHDPKINTAPVLTATVGKSYQYDVNAGDDDNDTLTYSLTLAPLGMTINEQTGQISWQPGNAQAGDHPVTVKVTDGKGGVDSQTFTLTVSSANLVTVPNLQGQNRAAATVAIQQARLNQGALIFTHSNSIADGVVIQQNPTAGKTVAIGTAINLTISLGPDQGLPPNPATVAPAIDPTVATTTYASTQLLYSGPNAIQTLSNGQPLAQDIIEAKRAAVIRGKVLDKQNKPLPGVKISILNHPEFGQTLSRADGWFDLAVNGGGYLTVNYQKPGFLQAQRQLNVPWQDYVAGPDVILINQDSRVTTVDLTSNQPMQVARGSISTDQDGSRQATVLFPRGTKAEMVMPDGSRQPLSTLSVRATEFTIGFNGGKAMPAGLPPNVAYTYAAVFTADEAKAAGAKDVVFEQPIPFYVENFLNFPVGIHVPLGAYDADKGQWVPSDSGKVIKILSVANGLAKLDTDGDNQPDSSTKLALLKITDAERQQLAALYTPRQTLWRSLIPHFDRPWDCNWPFGPPEDNWGPPDGGADGDDGGGGGGRSGGNGDGDEGGSGEQDPCEAEGSVIDCERQSLGESIDLVGTPFSLNYRSTDTPGWKSGRTVNLQLSGAALVGRVKRIDLRISIAGRTFNQSYPAVPNQKARFTWDGKDSYGRMMSGSIKADVLIGNVYASAVYMDTNLFGLGGNTFVSGSKTRSEVTHWLRQTITVQNAWRGEQDVAGWRFDSHHAYDPVGGVLSLGDGRQRQASGSSPEINRLKELGLPSNWYSLTSLALAPDGSLYAIDAILTGKLVRRIGPNGAKTVIAGGGSQFKDGVPATESISGARGLALSSVGSLYIAEPGYHRVRHIGSDGIITTIAGTGISGYSGDGGPATVAKLSSPYGVVVGTDGVLYIADRGNRCIRRVGTDGIIETFAGTCGLGGNSGDGGFAKQAKLSLPGTGLSIGADGALYIPDSGNNNIRRVGTDGIISTVAGTGNAGYSGDGNLATQAELNQPAGVAVNNDDTLFIADTGNHRVRRVSKKGIITTVAGTGGTSLTGDGGPAVQAGLSSPLAVALNSEGLYIADSGHNRIRKINSALPRLSFTEMVIAARDGNSLYVFDAEGRHSRTINALTGATLYAFTYDAKGQLISIADSDGDATTIERDALGRPKAIVSPFGQHSALTVDGNGLLQSVTNPAGETYHLSYTAGGLLTEFRDPKGNAYRMTYDEDGRLVKDENPAGGSQTLARTLLPAGFEVQRTSALGRTTRYRVENQPAGESSRVVTFPDGTRNETSMGSKGPKVTTLSDGTTLELLTTPDPRFGMQAPIDGRTQITTGELSSGTRFERRVFLNDPNDYMSLGMLIDTLFMPGEQLITRMYNAESRTFTRTVGRRELQLQAVRGSQRQDGQGNQRQDKMVIDAQGRIVQSEFAGLLPTNITYDTHGHLSSISQGSDDDARSSTLSYNNEGYIDKITDALGRETRYQYDLAGRVTQQIRPNGKAVQYTYDAAGNLTSVAPPDRPAHAFTYTPVNQQASYLPPDIGLGKHSTEYTYDKDKQLTRITRPDDKILDFAYDNAGRLSQLSIPQGDIRYSYDNATGKLTRITAADGGTLSYGYKGAMLAETMWTGTVNGSVQRKYGWNFRLSELKVNNADPITYLYDAEGLLTKAGGLVLNRNPQNGLLTGTALGKVTDTYTYDSFGEVTRYAAKFNGNEIFKIDYVYDKLGRITRKTETIEVITGTYDYTYDAVGRLVEVKKNGLLQSAYTYDANGNRLKRQTPGLVEVGTYDNQDRLLTYAGASYAYTANGELQSKIEGGQTTNYQYDVLGNLRQVTLSDATKIDYVIDGTNRRIGKKINGLLAQGFVWQDQLKPIAELNGNGNIVNRFVYANHPNVPAYMIKDALTYRIITDHLGSPRFVINTQTGQVSQRMDYDENGNVLLNTNPGFQPFGFAGGIYDEGTRLMRFWARDYDPKNGHWTTRDPLLFFGAGTNLSAYVENDPINRVDFIGLGFLDSLMDLIENGKPISENWRFSFKPLFAAPDATDITFQGRDVPPSQDKQTFEEFFQCVFGKTCRKLPNPENCELNPPVPTFNRKLNLDIRLEGFPYSQ